MRISFFFLFLAFSTVLSAQTMLPAAQWCAAGKKFGPPSPPPDMDLRSDSIDIVQTVLYLNITDFVAQTISGTAFIRFAAKVDGIAEIRLDLLNMSIDAVTSATLATTWTYDGQLLKITWPAALAKGDSARVDIQYHGKPVQDASGWGGFYWQGEYAYNLGVGFAADPHTFGRAWFPCFDNFVERCAFDVNIVSASDRPAYCNGTFLSQATLPDGTIRRHWVLQQPIPSYLACVAVGPYTSYKTKLPGEAGPVPVEIAVAPADSNKLKASFAHLPDALATFEYWYGPFRWPKIGYSIVPFNQGAMEHATNIAYMRAAVDGTTANENLFAHELSHHWWGDLATCSTAEDMWLNEGWAVYSEHLFFEHVYGPERFHDAVESNFLNVLEKTHVNEGGYRAVSGVPHAYTYGEHVYNKGAAVAHNLRGYLGDSLFRAGIRTALANNQFADWSSAGLRDRLSAATGKNLDDFFNDWVFSPGFTHFSVDSVRFIYSPVDAPTQVIVDVKQKLRGAPHFYQNVPLEFTFVYPDGTRTYRTAAVSGEHSALTFLFPAFQPAPVKVWINTRQHLTLARAEKELVAKLPAAYNFSPAKLTIKANSVTGDSALIRVEHHYVMPDTAGAANPNGYRLSDRYWSVETLPGNTYDGDLSVFYDGRGQLDQLDTELFDQTGPSEDSVILVYRPGPGFPWQYFPNTVKNTLGSAKDKYGQLRAPHAPPGEYAIAKGNATVDVQEPGAHRFVASVSPNPGRSSIRIDAQEAFHRVTVMNAAGELVLDKELPATAQETLNVSKWPAGAYRILLSGVGKTASVLFQKVN